MDINKLAQNLELEVDEYRELLDLFFRISDPQLIELQTSIDEKNFENTIEISHSFKGASGNLGIMGLHKTAGQIEHQAYQNQSEGLGELIRLLKIDYEELKKNTGYE